MYQNNCYDRDIDINNNFYAENMENNIDMNFQNNMMYNNTNTNQLIEPMQERLVHRTIMHEVNHVCPIRTRIINHHVFKHNFRPEYSCCEENVTSCVNDSPCNKF